jgi:hypothetical protein
MCPALHVDSMTREERKSYKEKVSAKLDAARRQAKPTTLDEWVEMFEDIYGTVNASRSSAQKTFHFLEEIGEVEVELRKADRKRENLPIDPKSPEVQCLSDHFKSGQRLSLQNRPTGLAVQD